MTSSAPPSATSAPAAIDSDLPAALGAWRDQGEFLQTGPFALNVFVRVVGKRKASAARTLLLIHGFPESSFSYNKNITALQKRFDRIVLFDFPGFGLSDKPPAYSYSLFEQADVALDVWRQLGISGGHVLAHDMGDSVLTEIIARDQRGLLPVWFKDGILSATFTNGNMVMEAARLRIMQTLLRTRLGPYLSRLSTFTIFDRQVRSANGGTGLSTADIQMMYAMLRHHNGHLRGYQIIKYLDERERFQNTRWLPALGASKIPVHICWGEADRVAPVAVANYLKTKVRPDARFTLMPGVGHFCQLDQPDIWAESVLKFWK